MREYHRHYLDNRAIDQHWLDPRLSQVRVANIVAYLRGKGWRPVPPRPSRRFRFRGAH